MASQRIPSNACGLFVTVIRQEKDWEDSRDFLASMWEVIKGLLGQDKLEQCFRTVYDLPKKEQQELAKRKGKEAHYAKDWAEERNGILTFKRYIYVPTGGGLWFEIIKTNHDLT